MRVYKTGDVDFNGYITLAMDTLTYLTQVWRRGIYPPRSIWPDSYFNSHRPLCNFLAPCTLTLPLVLLLWPVLTPYKGRIGGYG